MKPFSGVKPRAALAASPAAWLLLLLILITLPAHRSAAQTPSPLQEWQYVNALPLQRLYAAAPPQWSVVLGVGGEERPLYDGSRAYRFTGGPVFDVRYQDLVFLSTGEGFGINLIRTPQLTAGLTLGYDYGRKSSDDESNLGGLPNIGKAPAIKLFSDYIISKEFPLVIRLDLRRSIGHGNDGFAGDLSAYMPVMGSSPHLFMLIGPSLTWGSQQYLQKRFGVTPSEAMVSPHAEFSPSAGLSGVGIGYSATLVMTNHWLIELIAASSWALGGAQNSPLSQRVAQSAAALAISYRW